jgi:imidazolonepropionase-like amidohydrolase
MRELPSSSTRQSRSLNKLGAECLGWDDKLGTAETGKLADIVITTTDPLVDIRSLENAENIKLIIYDGRVFKNTLKT